LDHVRILSFKGIKPYHRCARCCMYANEAAAHTSLDNCHRHSPASQQVAPVQQRGSCTWLCLPNSSYRGFDAAAGLTSVV
jgi:hypothetical protein